MTHTPREWKIEAHPNNDSIWRIQAGWKSVATIWNDEGGANARLIAAAPDLLQQLEEAWEAINTLSQDVFGSANNKDGMTWAIRDELLYNMGLAIAKARGDA